MLKVMRDSFQHLKWILVFIVVLFILFIFVDWGGAGRTGGGSTNDLGAAAARVNGETISYSDFSRALYYAESRYEQMYGQKLTPQMRDALKIEKSVADQLVSRQLLLQEAGRLHLAATDEEVRKSILEMPVLNPDGKFVGPELYARYVTSLGYSSVSDFEREIARDLTLSKIQSSLESSIAVSPRTAEDTYRKRNENTRIQYVLYSSDRLVGSVVVSPAEIEAYFKEHSAKYAHGEQRRVKYLIADLAQARAKITPTDGDLRAYYDKNKESFKSKESVRAQHILLTVDRNAGPEADAAAKSRADGLVAQLRAGADFAALAKANSGDPGSAANGGDVGWFERGRMVPEFEQAAFSLKIGEISNPVKTQYGYHILKVSEKRPEGYRTFEEAKPELTSRFLDERSRETARDAIAIARTKIDNGKTKSEDALRTIAEATPGVALNDTQWFEKNDSIFGIGRSQELADWAFSAKEGEISKIIDTDRGPIVASFSSKRDAGVSELGDVRARVEADARREKAAALATEELKTKMSTPELDALAKTIGATVEEATVSRGGGIPKLQGDVQPVIEAAMKGNVGDLVGPISVAQGAVAAKVLEQKRFDPATYAKEKDGFVESLRQFEARKLEASLLDQLRKKAKVEINPRIVGGDKQPAI